MNGCFVLKADKYCKRDKLWILSKNKRKTKPLDKVGGRSSGGGGGASSDTETS